MSTPESMASDGGTRPEPTFDIPSAAQMSSRRNEIHRHIGAIVRNAAELEDMTANLISIIIDSDEPARVLPLVQGRRLSELIDTLGHVLPPYDEKQGLIKALRAVNGHRDRLAHSVSGFDVDDYFDINVHRVERQGRSSRTTHRLDLRAFGDVERDHVLTFEAVIGLYVGWMLPTRVAGNPDLQTGSVMRIIDGAAQNSTMLVRQDPERARLVEILSASELANGFTTV